MKSSALGTLILTLLSLLLCWVAVSEGIGRMNVHANETGIYMLAYLLCFLCTLIPILELSIFMSRKNIDTLYSVPLKKPALALAHYISGMIQIFTVYSVTFLSVYIHLELQTNYFRLEYMGGYYLLSLLFALVAYSVFMFLFMQANTVTDGILFFALWTLGMLLVELAMGNELWDFAPDIMPSASSKCRAGIGWIEIYSPIDRLTVIFRSFIEEKNNDSSITQYAPIYMQQIYMFFVWVLLGALAAVGYFVSFIRKSADRIGEISDSWFGYKLMIPVIGYVCLIDCDGLHGETVLVFIAMLAGYVIYRRGFKLKVWDYIMIACGLPFVIVGML